LCWEFLMKQPLADLKEPPDFQQISYV